MARSYYPSESLGLNIARGLVKGTSHIHIFGATPQINNANTATIWDVPSQLYPWSTFDQANTVTIETTTKNDNTSTLDDGKFVVINGLDEDYNQTTETLEISGSSATGNTVFKRIFSAYATNGGEENSTRIKISTNNTEVARINIGEGQTQMAIYTIPAKKTGYLLVGDATCQSGEGMTIKLYTRYEDPLDGVFRIAHEAEVSGSYRYDFPIPIPLPEKTDLDVRAVARTNNIRATAVFDLILINDNLNVGY